MTLLKKTFRKSTNERDDAPYHCFLAMRSYKSPKSGTTAVKTAWTVAMI